MTELPQTQATLLVRIRIPFVGYVRAGFSLDPRDFDAVPDFERSSFGCTLSTASIVKGVIFAAVLWLLGVFAVLFTLRTRRIKALPTSKPTTTQS